MPQHLSRPHLRILRRREAIEEPRITLRPRLRQARGDLVHKQGQRHAISQDNPLHAPRPLRPLRSQLCRQFRQLRPRRMRPLRRLARHQQALERHHVEPRARRRPMPPPQLPQRQQVQPGAKPQLANREMLAPNPPLRQPAPDQKHRALFGKSFARKIDIAMPAREWRKAAVFKRVEVQIGQGRQARHQAFGRLAVIM